MMCAVPEPASTPRRSSFSRLIRAAWAVFGILARKSWIAVSICALASFGGSVAYSVLVKWPDHRITDHFSHILLADTLRHFRLTNPPHPMWQHFETFHTLQQPTYASMYPPGQGFVLAIGWLLGGHPAAGVWLSGAILSAAIWWMLRGFFPP